jgi:hypothetical protein
MHAKLWRRGIASFWEPVGSWVRIRLKHNEH